MLLQKTKTNNLTEMARKGTCLEFFSAYQDLEIDRMANLATENATVWFTPLGDNGKGLVHEFGRDVWTLLIDCFPNLDNNVKNISVHGNLITCRVRIYGTQLNPFLGLPSRGLSFENDHIFIFHFDEDDKIKDLKIDWNHHSFVKQLTGE